MEHSSRNAIFWRRRGAFHRRKVVFLRWNGTICGQNTMFLRPKRASGRPNITFLRWSGAFLRPNHALLRRSRTARRQNSPADHERKAEESHHRVPEPTKRTHRENPQRGSRAKAESPSCHPPGYANDATQILAAIYAFVARAISACTISIARAVSGCVVASSAAKAIARSHRESIRASAAGPDLGRLPMSQRLS